QELENLGGWLTTVLARVCLDMLSTRRSRREEPLAAAPDAPGDGSLEDDLTLADATGPALLAVLEMLAPGERVAFVLHDVFDLSFQEVARILDCTPAAAGSSPVAAGDGCGARRPPQRIFRCIANW